MTDPKSRVQLPSERIEQIAQERGFGRFDALCAYLDERETQLHPPPPGWYMCEACELQGATVNLLEGGELWARVCQHCAKYEDAARGRIRANRAKTAALASPGEDKRYKHQGVIIGPEREDATHEGVTAAEWASRYADAELRAKTWKGEFERESKAAIDGRCEVGRLGEFEKRGAEAERKLRTAVEDCEHAVNGRETALAELTRLKEENARLSGERESFRIECRRLEAGWDRDGIALRATKALLADEKAAHEVTRRDAAALVDKLNALVSNLQDRNRADGWVQYRMPEGAAIVARHALDRTAVEVAELRRLAEACPDNSEQGYCCSCGYSAGTCNCAARYQFRFAFRKYTVLSLLDALDAAEAKLTGEPSLQMALAIVDTREKYATPATETRPAKDGERR